MVTASPYRPLKTPCLYPTLDTSGLLPCLLVSVVLPLLLVLPVWSPKVVVRSPNSYRWKNMRTFWRGRCTITHFKDMKRITTETKQWCRATRIHQEHGRRTLNDQLHSNLQTRSKSDSAALRRGEFKDKLGQTRYNNGTCYQ